MSRRSAIAIVVGGSAAVAILLLVLSQLGPALASLDRTTILMGGAAVIGSALLVAVWRRARAAGDLDASSALAFVVGWLPSVPIAAIALGGGVERDLDASRELVPDLPGWYENAVYASLAIGMAFACFLIARRLIAGRRRVPVNPAGLLAILLWLVAWLASGLQADRLVSLSGLALLVFLVAATLLPRGRGACVGVGLFGVTLAILSAALAAFQPDSAFAPCSHDCVLGDSFTGVMSNQNLLGTALVASLPFAYLGFRGRARIWLVLLMAGLAFTTGSRSAMATGVIIVVTLLVLRPSLDEVRPRPIRTAFAGALLGVAMLVSVYIVVHDWGPSDSLTDRPEYWSIASEYSEDAPLLGYGPDRWESLYTETGEIRREAQHSTHNQWVDVRFNAGWIGVALLVALLVAIVWSAGTARVAALVALCTIFLIGVGERAWSIGSADFASFSLVGLLLLGPAAVRAATPGRRRREAGASPAPMTPDSAEETPQTRIGDYLYLLRAYRSRVAACVAVGAAAGALLAWTATPSYEAKTQLFVSARGLEDAAGQEYEGGRFAQQRARTYAKVISGPRGAQAAIDELGLRASVATVQERIRATVPPNSFLIDIAVRDRAPLRAVQIARSLARQLHDLAAELETPKGSETSPVRIGTTVRARAPEAPISPQKPVYVALGALFGFVLALSVAILRRRLDRRVRTEREAAGAFSAPVLASIPERSTAADPHLPQFASPETEAYYLLRGNLRALAAEHDLRSFLISSPLPGEGKTEVAANLALALAHAEGEVIAVDANLRTPGLAQRLGIGARPGLAELLTGETSLRRTVVKHPVPHLGVLPAGAPPANPAELLDGDAFEGLLAALTDAFDFVIVDAPALLPVADAAIIAKHTSAVLVVAQAGATTARDATAAIRHLRAVDKRALGVVLNRVPDVDPRRFREDPLLAPPARGNRRAAAGAGEHARS